MVSRRISAPRHTRFALVLVAAATVAITLATASSARAATTIGSDLTAAADGSVSCAMGCTLGLRSIRGQEITAPMDGVVVRWRIKLGAGTDPQSMRLRIIRGTGAQSTAISSGPPEAIPAGADNHVFPAQLPIQAGDYIGVDCCLAVAFPLNVTTSSGLFDGWTPPLNDGQQTAPSLDADFELLLNADIEPDCDQDGLGDETQDSQFPLSEGCGKGNRALSLDANKNKVKRGKRVQLSGRLAPAARQGPCESGQTIELQRKKPSQASFTTFAQVQTDAQGSFSLKKKLRKTFEFRAQASETASCEPALSNIEKVKVKKKK